MTDYPWTIKSGILVDLLFLYVVLLYVLILRIFQCWQISNLISSSSSVEYQTHLHIAHYFPKSFLPTAIVSLVNTNRDDNFNSYSNVTDTGQMRIK